jgi:hypothetical protein
MTPDFDLRQLLQSWPFDPENDARFLRVPDGREVLQVRTPLGIEQIEVDGRPDGLRPYGMESSLAYQLKRLEEARTAGRDGDFELTADECAELFDEGTLYYLRYIRFFQLRDWARTMRDTARNLSLFDLVRLYAQREEDQQFLEKWRPYILRVNSTAAAMLELDADAYDAALKSLQDSIKQIEALPELDDETFTFERERSLGALRELAGQIQSQKPVSELENLQRQLEAAVDAQEFERAAELRDKIRELKKPNVH